MKCFSKLKTFCTQVQSLYCLYVLNYCNIELSLKSIGFCCLRPAICCGLNVTYLGVKLLEQFHFDFPLFQLVTEDY